SGDILQAAADKHLGKVRPGHTIAVVDTEITPTSAMLQSQVDSPGVPELEARIRERVGADRATFVDSKRIAEQVFANPLLANVVLLGAAFQLGALPLTLDAV